MLRRVLLADLDGDPMLQASLVTAYRNIFGGEEWQEWMRCTEPSCGRRYSHAATAALARPEWCECGASLEPFHPPALVAAMLRSDLAGGEVSRCYVRSGPDGSVDGFIWGYITTPEQLAGVLVEPEYARAQERLVAHLQQLVHSAGAPDKRIYYQSQIGVAEGMRSLSALRALFHRALQFASDNGVGVVVTRTHPHAPVYSLLKGLDLQIVHRYDDLMDQEGDGKQVLAQQVLAPGDTSDHRVVFGGNLQPIVTLTLAESDRRIALHLAHRLREIRENAITEAARAAKHAAE